mgnify:CR=1 FL=1
MQEAFHFFFAGGYPVTTLRKTQMMKLLLTLLLCFFAASMSAQTLTFQDGNLYITKRGKTEILAFVNVHEKEGQVETVEVAPFEELFNRETLQLVSSFLRSELRLADDMLITYVSAGARAGADYIRGGTNVEAGYQESARSNNVIYGKPALWRAGQHKLNALGWGAGGATVSVVVSLIASPVAGLVISGFSGIMAIVQSVKSAKAMQEAAGDYEAQFNQKQPAN